MKTVKDIIARIESFANPEKVLFKKKQFGIVSNNALVVMHSDLNALSCEIGKNEELAKALLTLMFIKLEFFVLSYFHRKN